MRQNEEGGFVQQGDELRVVPERRVKMLEKREMKKDVGGED